MKQATDYYEDEIDLREVAQTLLRSKWLILGTAVILALLVALLTKFMLPKEYKATAFILITKPSLTANFDNRLQVQPQTPDAKSLMDIAKSDDLLHEVYNQPAVKELFPKDFQSSDLSKMMEASLVGTGQLNLTVTDSNPIRAATTANTWADRLNIRLNDLYGTSQNSLVQIEDQIQSAYQNWQSKEQALIDKLPENHAEALQVQLDQSKDMLTVYLDRNRDLLLILSDSQNLLSRLDGQSASAPLHLEDTVSLVTLSQRAAGATESIQLQISSQALPEGSTDTVGVARTNLKTFIDSLQKQQQELQASIKDQQEQIIQLNTDLETAKYEKDQLTIQRDLALTAYQALSSQAEETRISLSQKDQTSKIAGRALPPPEPSGPSAVRNAIVAGALGFILAASLVLVRSWWEAETPTGITK